jgi:glyoxylase I family protein
MREESKTAHARLAEWTARKQAWRAERAAGAGTATLLPQHNDRPQAGGRKG